MINNSKANFKSEKPSEKSFGIVFFIVFLIVGLYPIFFSRDPHIWSLVISMIFIILVYFFPRVLTVPNILWFKFGLMIGSIIAPIIMALIYFLIVLPTGIFMRLLGKDLLNKKLNKNTNSYWIERKDKMGSMKNQF